MEKEAIPLEANEFYNENLYQRVDEVYAKYYNWDYSSEEIFLIYDRLETRPLPSYKEEKMAKALLLHYRAKVFFEEQEYEKAFVHYRQSVAIKEEFLPWAYPEKARSLENMSLCLFEQEDFYGALNLALQAAEQPERLPIRLRLDIYRNLSYIYKKIGDLDHSMTYLKNAIALCVQRIEKLADEDPEKQLWEKLRASLYIDMTSVLGNWLFDPQAAYPYAHHAVDFFSRHLHSRKDSNSLANARHNLGMMLEMLDSLPKAIDQYNQSLSLKKAMKKKGSRLASTYDNLGIIYKKTGELKLAKKYAFLAMQHHIEKSKNNALSYTYDNLGDVYFLEENFDSSIYCYNAAMAQILTTFDAKSVLDNPIIHADRITDKTGLYLYLSSKAEALNRKYKASNEKSYLYAAFEAYEKLDTLADIMRMEYRSDASKETFVERVKKVYERSIDLCMDLSELSEKKMYEEKAFHFAEKSKAVILLEALKRTELHTKAKEPLLEEMKKWHIGKNFYEKEYALATQNKQLDKARKLLDSLSKYRTRHEKLLINISEKMPVFKNLYQNNPGLSIAFCQDSLLSDDQCLLEFFQGDSLLYCFMISKDHFGTVEIPFDTIRQQEILSYNQSIKDLKIKSCFQGAQHIYQNIFSPLKASFPLPKHLIIVPDGLLNYLSFESLLSAPPLESQSNDLKGQPYLIKDYLISYNYSVHLWHEMQKERFDGQMTYPFVGFAPDFSSPSRLLLDDGTKMAALEMNIPETKEIQKRMGGKIFTGPKASSDQFFTIAPRARIIHLATHARANQEDGDLSFIVLAGQNRNSYDVLYAKDLYASQLKSDLVVLNACETHFGERQEGEGIISLARAFAYAGAKSMYTSLWLANEHASKEIALSFYNNLMENQNKATALRQAKLEYIQGQEINRMAHPFYWASFILIGDHKEISLD